jgi:type IV pilus assembly protein PilB
MLQSTSKKAQIIRFNRFNTLKQELVREGLITKEKLRTAEVMARREEKPLGDMLIQLRFVTEEQLLSFIGEKTHIPYVNIKEYFVDRKILDRIPEKIARRYNIMPLFEIEDVLTIAISDPLDILTLDDIARVAGCKVEAVIASDESIKIAIGQWYGVGLQEIIDELSGELEEVVSGEEEEPYGHQIVAEAHLKKKAEEPPIIKLVNSFIAQAILENASDIHLESTKAGMAVRFRIDGFLYLRHTFPPRLIAPVKARIKIMSGLDITKKRIPQDGRMTLMTRNKTVDIRTSTLPAMYGENIVLRVLDKSKGTPTLSEIGFSKENLDHFTKVIKAPQGMILATGPTGSGKTTTIYSAIESLNLEHKNIMTIEDPIEYEIEGAVQSQIDLISGFTFAAGLRSILRQDPDVIYVGEIRDLETAQIAVRAALTGHLVFSTLHANDAIATITRLRDIGIEAGLLGSVLLCSFAQRLVRKICPSCKKAYHPEESVLKELGLPLDLTSYKGDGCELCGSIGYKGRIGIFEILVADHQIRRLIEKNASENEIREAAMAQGMKSLFEDGFSKVINGVTTLEEIIRVTAQG